MARVIIILPMVTATSLVVAMVGDLLMGRWPPPVPGRRMTLGPPVMETLKKKSYLRKFKKSEMAFRSLGSR